MVDLFFLAFYIIQLHRSNMHIIIATTQIHGKELSLVKFEIDNYPSPYPYVSYDVWMNDIGGSIINRFSRSHDNFHDALVNFHEEIGRLHCEKENVQFKLTTPIIKVT